MLRSRKSRREEPIGAQAAEPRVVHGEGADPEGEAVLADSVGVALLVVLDTLTPAERLAFVLHDLFAMPFDEIGPIVGRSPAAAKQLASRARRRVRGCAGTIGRRPGSAARSRGSVSQGGAHRRPRGPPRCARSGRRASHRWRGAHRRGRSGRRQHAARAQGRRDMGETVPSRSRRGARFVQLALINGSVGLIFAPSGRLSRVLIFTFANDKVTRVEVIGDPARLRELDIAVL